MEPKTTVKPVVPWVCFDPQPNDFVDSWLTDAAPEPVSLELLAGIQTALDDGYLGRALRDVEESPVFSALITHGKTRGSDVGNG